MRLALRGLDDSCGEHERALYAMLESAAEGADSLSMEQLQRRIAENPQWSIDCRGAFDKAVDADFGALGLTEKKTLPGGMKRKRQLLIAAALTVVLGVPYGIWIFGSGVAGIILAAFWAVGILVGNSMRSRTILTQAAEDERALWEAFCAHLGELAHQEAPGDVRQMEEWKRNLVYAVALGEERELFEAFAVWFPDSEERSPYNDWYFRNRYWFHRSWYDSLNHVQEETYSASVSSDGGGGGGGFSSSGGGSGGGSTGSGAD